MHFYFYFGLLLPYLYVADAKVLQENKDLSINSNKKLIDYQPRHHKLDTSCKKIKPPEVPNARFLRYKTRKSTTRFTIAIYECNSGKSAALFCSKKRWIGRKPICEALICAKGYRLADDGRTCEDVNECYLRNGHGPCQDTCENTDGSYRCGCGTLNGTRLAADQHTCSDVNECTEGTSGCSHSCVNTHGRAFCTCPSGMELDADWKTCKDINECADPQILANCKNCVNFIGSYFCDEEAMMMADEADANETTKEEDEEYEEEGDYDDEDYDENADYEEKVHDKEEAEATTVKVGSSTVEVSGVKEEIVIKENKEEKSVKEKVDYDDEEYDENVEENKNKEDNSIPEVSTAARIPVVEEEIVKETSYVVGKSEKDEENAKEEEEYDDEDYDEDADYEEENEESEVTTRKVDSTTVEEEEIDNELSTNEITTEKMVPVVTTTPKSEGTTLRIPVVEEEIIKENSYVVGSTKKEVKTAKEEDEYDDEDYDSEGDYDEEEEEESSTTTRNLIPTLIDSTTQTTTDITSTEMALEETTPKIEDKNPSNEVLNKIDDYEEVTTKLASTTNKEESSIISLEETTAKEGESTTSKVVETIKEKEIDYEDEYEDGDYEEEDYREESTDDQIISTSNCTKGFKRVKEECIDIDECNTPTNQCSHTCANTLGSYHCTCPPGFLLSNSDLNSCQDLNECLSNPCSDICINTAGSFQCKCNDPTHSLEDNKCTPKCSHGQTRINNQLQCTCPGGFYLGADGRTCEDVDECQLQGSCTQACRNIIGSFECACEAGFNLHHDGKTCMDIDECLVDHGGCPTANGGKCKNVPGSFECVCLDGYHLAEEQCVDINECENTQIHLCSQLCVNYEGGYECDCQNGYSLMEDFAGCADINECAESNGNCSQSCVNYNGTFSCACFDGFVLSLDNSTCTAVDPCASNNGGCSHSCLSLNNQAVCACPEGYELNQTHCVEVNQCLVDNGGCSHICAFLESTTICSCPQSHNLLNSTHCFLKNPCETMNGGCSHTCVFEEEKQFCECPANYYLEGKNCYRNDPCLVDNGGCSHDCLSNDEGVVECSCPDHHNLINKTCVHVNPCFINNGGCSHECVSEENQVYCLCPDGFKLNGKTCTQLNPCLEKNGGCSHQCNSINGQVICKCPPNFELINKTCFKINPCLINNGGCSHGCTNTDGMAKCACPPGYKLFGKRCLDQDPCEKNNGNCSHICKSTVNGMRECYCPAGYLLRPNKRVCKEINECRLNKGGCSHGCRNLPGSFQCTCPNGFELRDNKTCIDVDECLRRNGDCQGSCENLVGGFRCVCPNGYLLQRDNKSCKRRLRVAPVKQCAALRKPENGNVRCLHSDYGNAVPSGTKCNIWCNDGFKLAGRSINLCNANGQWENSEAKCISATCPKTPAIQNGWFLPGVCNSGKIYPGESCYVYCRKGYKPRPGIEAYSCRANLEWAPQVVPEKLETACVKDIPQVYLKCPGAGKLSYVLAPGQSNMFVRIPRPESNIDWKYITSDPAWGKRLETTLPAGRTEVSFTATDFNSTTTCRLVIDILDKENPRISGCPTRNIEATLRRGQSTEIISWNEPQFTDNVGVATVYKSRHSGTEFGAGLHHVNYVVSDEGGNRAFCHFTVTIKEEIHHQISNAISSEVVPNQHQGGRYRAVLICPSGVQYMNKQPDNYDNTITNEAGCYWRHVRVTKPMHQVYPESRLPTHIKSRRRYFNWSK